MKLNLIRPRTGLTWVRQGMRLFLRQPLAMSGLFFMFMAVLSLASLVPLIGPVLALVLLPAATLGLMAASREAEQGRFPMPFIMASALRAGAQQARAMLLLGVLYALGFAVVIGLSSLIDGGEFARLYLFGGKIDEKVVSDPQFQAATWAAALLYAPLSLVFWHAPALVHWHRIDPVKSLFFSAMACWKNLGAFIVYALGWFGCFLLAGVVVALLASLFDSPTMAATVMLPVALIMAAMFFSSVYATFRDSFTADERAAPQVDEVA